MTAHICQCHWYDSCTQQALNQHLFWHIYINTLSTLKCTKGVGNQIVYQRCSGVWKCGLSSIGTPVMKWIHNSIISYTWKDDLYIETGPMQFIIIGIWKLYTGKVKCHHDEFTYPFPNFNGCTVQFWESLSNFIPHFMNDVIIFPCWG